ncbi:MAG: two pore domain potassium channel family protein, partial [Deltaproteobacteria bacterium]|nr:two pore domain potassium channel family protein [Deltaproteobacteria bacterium]
MLKFTGSQARNNLVTLLKYFLFLVFTVFMYAGIFKGIMFWVEGRKFSWITSFYWTLTVMSTLGFGDITFNSDTGRLFSIFVLISGIILLTIVLPFVFIRFFYAPWLEARIHFRTPRELPAETEGHVIICRYESVAQALLKKLSVLNIPYV